MSFKTEVENITDTVSDTSALNDWLKSGAWDIINRVKLTDPSKLQSFSQQKDISNNTASVGGNLLLGVYSSAAKYREISPSLKIKALDSDSIHKATLTDPVYWKENGNIYLRPTGGSSNTMSIVEIDSTNLVHSQSPSDVQYFPDDMKHLLVYYAAMQQIQYLLMTHKLPLDTTIDLSGISLPVLPITFTAATNLTTWDNTAQSRVVVDTSTMSAVPVYNSPIMEDRVKFSDYVSGLSATDPGVFSLTAEPPAVPVLNLVTIDSSSWTQPNFVAPVFEDVDWSNTNKWIEDEEDPEMLAARVQEISAKAGEFTSKLSESQMRFNKELEIYKAEIQKSVQDATFSSTKESQEIQKYQSELQQYQAEVNSEVGTYTAKMGRWTLELNTKLSAWTQEENEKIQRFSGEVQNNLNDFNEENIEYQATLQIALENARLSSAADGILMQRFKNEVESYMAEVNSKVQEFTLKLQARTLEYQWLQEQYLRVKDMYESGFVPFQAPKEKD
tara:strand:- start:1345 stop:2850 length:1506 start_codon:yes stop_codon:yes gene_type:complete